MSNAQELYRNEVYTHDMFNPFVGKDFRVINVQGEFYIKLAAANHLSPKNWPDKFRPPFELLFFSPPGAPCLNQGQYLIQTAGSQVWAMFITPVVTLDREKGQMYQAVFA